MPRAGSESKFYHSNFTASSHPQYLQDQQPPSATTTTTTSSPASPTPSSTTSQQKKKHVCPTCERAFTTSGHLARHSRVHTGERNHKCPFPGCETRCSRQDNLQQHYRIHLSPGSRRSSARSAIARAMNGGSKRGAGATLAAASSASPDLPPPLSAPPALEPARMYAPQHSPAPDSPPPLAQATLPATAHHLAPSARSSASPETSYAPLSHHQMPQQNMGMSPPPHQSPQSQYSYRSGTTTYQEQSQGATNFTYVHTTPLSHNGQQNSLQYPPHHLYDNGSNSAPVSPDTASGSPVAGLSLSSRHSISHISHPQPYPPTASPPSPASSHSVSSHTSGPPTPTYAYDEHAYQHTGLMGNDGGHHVTGNHLVHGYSPTIPMSAGGISRFESPPPVLAPIQGERGISRREDSRSHQHMGSHHNSPYMASQQALPQDYPYHQQHLGLGPGAWKDNGMRVKGVPSLIQ
ncbi:hypothetical protein HGRIS_010402 [Hohenbuehelia grisea]|uniref:C2H2-type domain-containing protein n=1 Tax=Hohenbuehelia grisea TaxID=104357 RepID=A0ABR3J4M6_9AGAR